MGFTFCTSWHGTLPGGLSYLSPPRRTIWWEVQPIQSMGSRSSDQKVRHFSYAIISQSMTHRANSYFLKKEIILINKFGKCCVKPNGTDFFAVGLLRMLNMLMYLVNLHGRDTPFPKCSAHTTLFTVGILVHETDVLRKTSSRMLSCLKILPTSRSYPLHSEKQLLLTDRLLQMREEFHR